jgi:hypothetical protein
MVRVLPMPGPRLARTGSAHLFHKGAQLFGAVGEHLTAGAVPVVVETPWTPSP